MFYAQNGEDVFLAENWDKLGLPADGIFVEVGVGDGTNISNTLWLEQRGWVGLLVEPDPRQFETIRANRKAQLATCAIGTRSRPFVLAGNPELSGFRRVPAIDELPADLPAVTVAVASLTFLLAAHGITAVDVLSIDTEGTELEAWSTLDLTRFRPRVVFMEWYTSGLGEQAEAIKARMTQDSYQCVATLGCNLVFIPNEVAW